MTKKRTFREYLIFVSPIIIPIFFWFMYVYGLKFIVAFVFSVWELISDFLSGDEFEENPDDPYDYR